jgi:predicted nucleic acid-binding Zn ribbon protein
MRSPSPGDSSGPEPIGDILNRLFAARGWGRKQERLQLEEAWNVVAKELLNHTRITSLKRGILEVEVRSSVLLQELTQFQKKPLLTGMQKRLPERKIKDLKFRLGVFE